MKKNKLIKTMNMLLIPAAISPMAFVVACSSEKNTSAENNNEVPLTIDVTTTTEPETNDIPKITESHEELQKWRDNVQELVNKLNKLATYVEDVQREHNTPEVIELREKIVNNVRPLQSSLQEEGTTAEILKGSYNYFSEKLPQLEKEVEILKQKFNTDPNTVQSNNEVVTSDHESNNVENNQNEQPTENNQLENLENNNHESQENSESTNSGENDTQETDVQSDSNNFNSDTTPVSETEQPQPEESKAKTTEEKKTQFNATVPDIKNKLEQQSLTNFGHFPIIVGFHQRKDVIDNIIRQVEGQYSESNYEKMLEIKRLYDDLQEYLKTELGKLRPNFTHWLTQDEVIELWKESLKRITFESDPQHSEWIKYGAEHGLTNDVAYDAMLKFLEKDLKNYPYFSISSLGTPRFDLGTDFISQSAFMRNILDDKGSKQKTLHTKIAMELVKDSKMSVHEKVYVLMKYVAENMNYVDNEPNLQKTYVDFEGVCKEYVDVLSWLLSSAGIKYRIATGDAHIFMAYQDETGKWTYTDPTFVDTAGSTTGENAKKIVIGQPGDNDLDNAAQYHTFRYTPSVSEVNQAMFNLNPSANAKIDNINTKESLKDTIVGKIQSLYGYDSTRLTNLSALQYYNRKFYFIEKEGEIYKLKTLDAVNKGAEADVMTLEGATALLLNQHGKKLYYVKGDKLWSIDLANANAQKEELTNSNGNITSTYLMRFSETPYVIFNNEQNTKANLPK
ncbi:hypothetical protein [Mycoplasma sp. Ms02]|uniref:hypothetical protein n=1 Tax=Mycoplasma sp. Ms02 TaxID=353851 RepID=UPI001C89E23B|nr:hypothetical protein [Mycoplasma sp. Ms02]QZE12055.1 hypothetical protein K4L35_01700 [Mycoplasma sp. Ms02]